MIISFLFKIIFVVVQNQFLFIWNHYVLCVCVRIYNNFKMLNLNKQNEKKMTMKNSFISNNIINIILQCESIIIFFFDIFFKFVSLYCFKKNKKDFKSIDIKCSQIVCSTRKRKFNMNRLFLLLILDLFSLKSILLQSWSFIWFIFLNKTIKKRALETYIYI